jgi:hypothetical protein
MNPTRLSCAWCDIALTGISSKQYWADNLIAVRELVSTTKPSASNKTLQIKKRTDIYCQHATPLHRGDGWRVGDRRSIPRS